MTDTAIYTMLAHLVLFIHFSFVAFVVIGLLLTWLGYFMRWDFVRNFYFRAAHILSMGIVLMESLLHIECPLTGWENDLRLLAGQVSYQDKSFMQYWIHKIMFFQLEPGTFTIIYSSFFTALVLSFIFVRPKLPGWFGKKKGPPTAIREDGNNPGRPETDDDPRDS